MTSHEQYAALYAEGLLPRADSLASVSEYQRSTAGGAPAHILRARVAGGFDVEILPGRGLDIGRLELAGIPLSWQSPVADARPLDVPDEAKWMSRFAGGLLTTCGLENIGPAGETGPMHGTIGHRPARITHAAPEVGSSSVRVEGVVEHAQIFGPSLQLRRCITLDFADDGAARLAVRDTVTNLGPVAAHVAVLYHVNLGAPLVVPGTTVDFSSAEVVLRESCPEVPDMAVLPKPTSRLTEAVAEHISDNEDCNGRRRALVTAPSGLRAVMEWSATTLPRSYQWVLPTRKRWALGLEPANAPLFGPGRDGPHGGVPQLDVDEETTFEIVLTAYLPDHPRTA
jgi:hypothetical protein